MAWWSQIPIFGGLLDRHRKPRLVRIVRHGRDCLATLHLEVADSIHRRAKGLMGRTSLVGADGMLFIYPWPRTVRIWMASTLIPLDALFVDRSGTIIKIAKSMSPRSRKWISSGQSVKWVLEIEGGRAEVLGIVVGDHMEIESP